MRGGPAAGKLRHLGLPALFLTLPDRVVFLEVEVEKGGRTITAPAASALARQWPVALARNLPPSTPDRCAAQGMVKGRDFAFCADGKSRGSHSKLPDAIHCVVMMFSKPAWHFDQPLSSE
jgi:hypothetical protein